jgi:hypothetical protein
VNRSTISRNSFGCGVALGVIRWHYMTKQVAAVLPQGQVHVHGAM